MRHNPSPYKPERNLTVKEFIVAFRMTLLVTGISWAMLARTYFEWLP